MRLRTIGSFLIAIALFAGMLGCTPGLTQYDLTISVTEGGEVVTPGEGTFPYEQGAAVTLIVFPHTGYGFVSWSGDVETIADANAASTTITMDGDYEIIANFEEILPLTFGIA